MDLRFGTTTFTRQISEHGLELIVRGASPQEAFADAYQLPNGMQGVVDWQLVTAADGQTVLQFDTYARDAEGNTLYMVQRPFQIDVDLSQAQTRAGATALVHVNGWKEALPSNQE